MRTDRDDEAKSRFSQFCERVYRTVTFPGRWIKRCILISLFHRAF